MKKQKNPRLSKYPDNDKYVVEFILHSDAKDNHDYRRYDNYKDAVKGAKAALHYDRVRIFKIDYTLVGDIKK